jgi:tetratricopeptide (TPR) repeat protein
MYRYGVRDVEKLLSLSRSTIRALIEAGFVSPARGPRNAWRFSFQDLVVLRTAQALASAKVPRRRITRSLKELRRHLPETMPLSGLSICAEADRVIVKQGGSRWQAESGQYLLAFDADPASGTLSVVERARENGARAAQEWFRRGVSIETEDAEAAIAAYERAVAADPTLVDAHVNLGSLLHEAGALDRAESVYRRALDAIGAEAVLLFNLGVLLEDMERPTDALHAYEAAVREDPDFADAHYNLALLYDELGRPRDAIRHMARYRKLSGGKR